MLVLGACIDLELAEHLTTHRVLREHALDGELEGLLRLGRHQLAIAGLLKAAGVSSVIAIELLIELVAGKNQLGSVDHDHEITRVLERGIRWLVLAAKNLSDFTG